MNYDEDRVLTNYVCEHYSRYMTPLERGMMNAILLQQKMQLTQSSALRQKLLELHQVSKEDYEAALVDGPEQYRRQVRNRLIAEHRSDVFINRCSQCQRVVRTPEARQCFWCGFDWHSVT
jgi:hypothetical protein